MAAKKEASKVKSIEWFYYVSILAVYLFTLFIAAYASIHFEDIKYMNLELVFLFLSVCSFFLISWIYFITEKQGYHNLAPAVFFAGIVWLIFYAYSAADSSKIVKYSIIYAIIVSGISLFVLLADKKLIAVNTANKPGRNAGKPK